jgi:uncharacterized membrane protein
MQHKVIIRRHVHPWVRVGIIAAAVSLVAIGAWAFYAYLRATTVSGFERAQLEVEALQSERRELNRSLRQANSENERLRDELTYLRRSQEIDGQTCENVKASLDVLQAEVLDLREQVAFYRGIVSPEMARAGVRVYSLKVHPAEGLQNYRFEVVLIQSMRHERQVDGELRVTVEGLRGGKTAAVPATADGSASARNLLFSFRYFQEFNGAFTLPAGFSPRQIRVQLIPEGVTQPIEESFDWDKSLAP